MQSCTWRMTVHCECINLEPLELTGLRLCLHNLRELFTKLKKKSASQLVDDIRTCLISCFVSVPPHSWNYLSSMCNSAEVTPYSEPNSSCCQQRF